MPYRNVTGIGHGADWGNIDPSSTPWNRRPAQSHVPFQRYPQNPYVTQFGAIGDERTSRSATPASTGGSRGHATSSSLDPRTAAFFPGSSFSRSGSMRSSSTFESGVRGNAATFVPGRDVHYSANQRADWEDDDFEPRK